MTDTPLYLQLGFTLITIASIGGTFWPSKSKLVLTVFVLIGIYSAALASMGFFHQPDAMPPRLPLVILPALLFMIWLFFSGKGRGVLNKMDMKRMTYVHTVRVPVELCIFALFTYGLMPESMSFEGRNWDVFSGLTAPLIAYFGAAGGEYRNTRCPKCYSAIRF